MKPVNRPATDPASSIRPNFQHPSPGIEVVEHASRDEFIGTQADLVAAGVATTAMFPVAPKRVRSNWGERNTPQGARFRVERLRGGRFRVTRWLATSRAEPETEAEAPAKSRVLSIVPDDRDNMRMLSRLGIMEVEGEVAGIVAIVLSKSGMKRRFSLMTSGAADSNPALAVGAMVSCLALLQEDALNESGLIS